MNWLQVLGTAELPHIDQGVRQQFHAKMSLLHVFKPQQQPLEFVLPRKGPIDPSSQGMDGGIEESLTPWLGALAVAEILCDIGNHARIEHALEIVCGIKARVEIDIGAFEVQTDLFGHLLRFCCKNWFLTLLSKIVSRYFKGLQPSKIALFDFCNRTERDHIKVCAFGEN
jgi:hypothetical protein